MAFMKSKGCILATDISGSYVTVPQLESITKSGEKNETYPAHTIDGVVGKVIAPTGFNDNPKITAKGFYDAANAVHVSLFTNLRAVATKNAKITYTDSGPLSEIWSGVGWGVDVDIEKSKGVMFTLTIEASGNPS